MRIQLMLQLTAAFAAACVVTASHAQDKAALRKLAMEVPIADVHMHVYPGLKPAELLEAMDENKVLWGGGVGAVVAPARIDDFLPVLGKRYFPAGGQAEYVEIYRDGKVPALESADHPLFVKLKADLDRDLASGKIRGIGELILNNVNSHPNPAFRRKATIDAAPIKALFSLAEKHQAFVQIHMEDDPQSLKQLGHLLEAHPRVPVILSHCLAVGGADSARQFLSRYPNAYCELSARSPAVLQAPVAMQKYGVHDHANLEAPWLDLIEQMPDRFMVGSDSFASFVRYGHAIRLARSGLLANLSEATMRKVAYENAVRVFRLPAAEALSKKE